MDSTMMIVMAVLFLGSAVFMALLQPLWAIIECAVSKDRSGTSKVIWIILMILLWGFVTYLYSVFATGSKLLRFLSIMALMTMIGSGAYFIFNPEIRATVQDQFMAMIQNKENQENPESGDNQMTETVFNIEPMVPEMNEQVVELDSPPVVNVVESVITAPVIANNAEDTTEIQKPVESILSVLDSQGAQITNDNDDTVLSRPVTIFMKDGRKFQGTLYEENPKTVIFTIGAAKVTLNKTEIDKIE